MRHDMMETAQKAALGQRGFGAFILESDGGVVGFSMVAMVGVGGASCPSSSGGPSRTSCRRASVDGFMKAACRRGVTGQAKGMAGRLSVERKANG